MGIILRMGFVLDVKEHRLFVGREYFCEQPSSGNGAEMPMSWLDCRKVLDKRMDLDGDEV